MDQPLNLQDIRRELLRKVSPRDEEILKYYYANGQRRIKTFAHFHPNDTNPNVNYKAFFQRPEIKVRIRQLIKNAKIATSLTIFSVLKKLEDSYQAATADGQHSAAVRAAELLGKHIQMFTEKIQIEANVTGLEGGSSIDALKKDITRLMSILNITKEPTDGNAPGA